MGVAIFAVVEHKHPTHDNIHVTTTVTSRHTAPFGTQPTYVYNNRFDIARIYQAADGTNLGIARCMKSFLHLSSRRGILGRIQAIQQALSQEEWGVQQAVDDGGVLRQCRQTTWMRKKSKVITRPRNLPQTHLVCRLDGVFRSDLSEGERGGVQHTVASDREEAGVATTPRLNTLSHTEEGLTSVNSESLIRCCGIMGYILTSSATARERVEVGGRMWNSSREISAATSTGTVLFVEFQNSADPASAHTTYLSNPRGGP